MWGIGRVEDPLADATCQLTSPSLKIVVRVPSAAGIRRTATNERKHDAGARFAVRRVHQSSSIRLVVFVSRIRCRRPGRAPTAARCNVEPALVARYSSATARYIRRSRRRSCSPARKAARRQARGCPREQLGLHDRVDRRVAGHHDQRGHHQCEGGSDLVVAERREDGIGEQRPADAEHDHHRLAPEGRIRRPPAAE